MKGYRWTSSEDGATRAHFRDLERAMEHEARELAQEGDSHRLTADVMMRDGAPETIILTHPKTLRYIVIRRT